MTAGAPVRPALDVGGLLGPLGAEVFFGTCWNRRPVVLAPGALLRVEIVFDVPLGPNDS